jgi:hypothetical protein
MSFGTPDPPPAPNPKETIAAQSAANKEAIEAQAKFNRINQVNPQGTLTYSGTPGEPDYTQTVQYDPRQQALFDKQQGIQGSTYDLVSGQLQRLDPVLRNTLDTSILPDQARQISGQELPNMIVGANDADITSASNRLADESFGQFMRRFEPQIERSRQRTEQRIADQGLDPRQDLAQNYNTQNENSIYDAMQNAAAQAQGIGTDNALKYSQFGNQARTQMLNEMLAMQQAQTGQRQSALQEQAYLRNVPINDIAALLGTSGGVQTPQFSAVPSVSVPTTDAGGIINSSYQNQLNAFNSRGPSFTDQLFGLAGSALGGWAGGGFKV